MTTQEGKIRTAIQETAAEIPPDHSPPLRLPLRHRRTLGTLRPRRTLGTLRRRGPQRWPGWVAPLAAAVTVTVVIAGTFALTRDFARTHVSAHHGAGPVGGWTGPVTGGAGPPAYYVFLGPVRPGTAGGPLPEATITSTRTGKPVATVASPRPYVGFDFVAAAGNSSTFVLAAQQQNQIRRAGRSQGVVAMPEKFFLLRVSPTGHTRLTPLGLPVRVDPGFLAGIALSPDGSRLALASGLLAERLERMEVDQFARMAAAWAQQLDSGMSRRSLLVKLSAGLSMAAANPALAMTGADHPALTSVPASPFSLSGIWHSRYLYYSTGRGHEFEGEHYVVLRQDENRLDGQSLPHSMDSLLRLHLSVDGGVATGTWTERTSPDGYYKGATYHGTIQLLIDPWDGD